MKTIINYLLVIFFSLFLVSCGKRITEQEARQVLSQHLLNKYKEPFHIEYIGKRSDGKEVWYEAEIYPQKYVGQPQSNDKYYKHKGTVDIKKNIITGESLGGVGDTYGIIAVNDSANKFYMPKLKELFGEQVLPVIEVDAGVLHTSYDFISTLGLGGYIPVKGGVYIFGRIDSLEEKEKYRKNIFDFIEYMKFTNTFEYVNLAFYILDERCLTERFETEVGPKLVEARKKLKTSTEFLEYRSTLLKELDNDFNKMTKEDKIMKINSFNKNNLLDMWGWDYPKNKLNKYSVMNHKVVRSRKYLETDLRLHEFKKLDFNNMNELRLYNTLKVDYDEYDKKKFYNQEWDGE
ncbi:hypothetical protein [Fusobacterium sp. PH5-44]|uniref:hypothetical protein n=1 Tax=unclassified Fusobacterium TaxID=2648384 RepID=UPI003D1E3A64